MYSFNSEINPKHFLPFQIQGQGYGNLMVCYSRWNPHPNGNNTAAYQSGSGGYQSGSSYSGQSGYSGSNNYPNQGRQGK